MAVGACLSVWDGICYPPPFVPFSEKGYRPPKISKMVTTNCQPGLEGSREIFCDPDHPREFAFFYLLCSQDNIRHRQTLSGEDEPKVTISMEKLWVKLNLIIKLCLPAFYVIHLCQY